MYVIYKLDDFVCLESTSQHQIMANHVKSLYYEADMLRSFERWEDLIMYRDMCQKRSRNSGIFEEVLPDNQPLRDSEPELAAFKAYKSYIRDQNNIMNQHLDSRYLTTLFQACPHLDTVNMRIHHQPPDNSKASRNAFRDALVRPPGDHDALLFQVGCDQLEALCRAIHNAGRTLKHFSASEIGWDFLDPRWAVPKDRAQLVDVFRPLQYLRLRFRGLNPEAFESRAFGQSVEEEILEESDEALNRGTLRNLLSATEDLRVLKLRMPPNDFFFGLDLRDKKRTAFVKLDTLAGFKPGASCNVWL